jgi:predicted nucleotidyltransferase component of viral defense system
MTLNISTHKTILVKILKDIYSNSILGNVLGFKGGTAANLFYGLNRFSVDLDFDLLDESKENYVFEEVKKILENYGEVKEARKKRFNLFYLLSYNQKESTAQNIKVEINRRNFNSQYELKNYLGITMKVMVKEDMFAHKLVAAYERLGKTNRDLFDVWFFLKNDWPINKNIIEERTKMKFSDFLNKLIQSIEKLPQRGILAGMGELLDEKTKNWVKLHLKEDLLFLLKLKLETESKT